MSCLLSGRVDIIGKREVLLFGGPFGVAMYLCGMKFINRKNGRKSVNTLNVVAEDLKKRQSKMWVYPEGTRRNTRKIHEFKKGAFYAAIHAKLPITPIVFSSFSFLDKEHKIFSKGNVIITILPEISTEGMKTEDVDSLIEKTRNKMIEIFQETSIETM